MFFAGTSVTGIFITRLGDIYGRMWITRVSSLLSILVQAAIITSTNFNLIIFLFFMLGVTSPGKNQVGFVYASEITREKHRAILGSCILFIDSSAMIVLPMYHKVISKNWVYF